MMESKEDEDLFLTCENMLQILYFMLEYAEEPVLCRRNMLLSYFGHPFSSEQCLQDDQLCDNCAKGL